MKFKNLSSKKKILLLLSAVVIAAAVVIVIFFFLGRGGDREELPAVQELPIVDAPTIYELEGLDHVPALPVGDRSAAVVRADVPEKQEKGSEETADTEQEPHPLTVAVTYHYEGVPTPLSRIVYYCRLLTAEDFGFIPVDEDMMEAEMPALEELTEGSVHLVRPVTVDASGTEVEDATLFSLRISWNGEKCVVSVGRIAGKIVVPKPEPEPYRPPLTVATAIDYFYDCHPSDLGLPGESMEAYQVLLLDGAVLVGTTPCLRINVYAIDEKTGTNVIAGQYLLSDNGMTLLRIDKEGNIVEVKR